MITQNNSFMSCSTLLPPYLLRLTCNNRNGMKFRISFSKKQDSTDERQLQDPTTITSLLRVPNRLFLARSAVAILGLGFIDAGYSGDWSRIGVISKEIEELLKIAAFVVVPLCLYLILSLSKKEDDQEA